jgi:DnaJ-class molecular chaperone
MQKNSPKKKGLFEILFGRYTKGPVCTRCHGHGYFHQGPTRIPCHRCKGTGGEPE